MKAVTVGVALFLAAISTFGQQSTTNTDCNVNGQQVNCTSTTTTPPPPSGGVLEGVTKTLADNRARAEARRDQSAQQAQLSEEAMREMLAEQEKEKENKDTVDFIYCRQNPSRDITNYEGKQEACADVIEYTKAFCLVNPDAERCTLAKSKTEVERAFASLVNEYNADPRRNKRDGQMYFDSLFAKLTRWGCMSFPDMTLPQRDGTLHPCPNAPEAPVSVDAASQTK